MSNQAVEQLTAALDEKPAAPASEETLLPPKPGAAPPDTEPPAPISLGEKPPGDPKPPASPDPKPAPAKPADDDPLAPILGVFEKHFPEPVVDAKGKIDWGKNKAGVASIVNENRALTIELEAAKTGGDSALKEQLESANARLKELEPVTQEVEQLRAIKGIEDNPAFREKYDAGRVALQERYLQIAQEAGVPEGDAKQILAAGTELQAAKALAELVEDDTAKSLLQPLATQFIQLSRERAAQLKTEDPVESLKEWKERSQAKHGEETLQIRQRGVAAAEEAIEKIGDDPLMKTEAGKAKVAAFKQRIEANEPMTEADAYASMLRGEFAEDWKEFGMAMHAETQKLKAEIAKLQGLRPGSPTPPPPGDPARGPQAPFQGSAPPDPEWPAPIKIQQ